MGPFKMYSEYDIESMIYLRKNIATRPKLDYDSLLSMYGGHNVFSIFY